MSGSMLVSQYHKSDMIEPRTAVTHRRQLLVALATGLIGHSVMFTRSALAQQAAGGPGKVWRVGIVPGGLYAPRKYQWDVFFGQMQTLGYVDGKNVHYEIRAPEKEGASFDDPINALVNLKVDALNRALRRNDSQKSSAVCPKAITLAPIPRATS